MVEVDAPFAIITRRYLRPAQAIPQSHKVVVGNVAIAINVPGDVRRATLGVHGGAGNGQSAGVTHVADSVMIDIASIVYRGRTEVQTIDDAVTVKVPLVGQNLRVVSASACSRVIGEE
jgi:hypothetical protein